MNLKLTNNQIDDITNDLLSIIPRPEIDRIFRQKYCDIDPEFLGFIYVYKNLSEIIPKHFTIVDLGCAYNPQAYLFTEHHKYIAVDLPGPDGTAVERFCPDNCIVYEMSISNFIKDYISDLDLDTCFAICNYVPPWHDDNMKLVRNNFVNVFCYYPKGGNVMRLNK